MCNKKHVWKTNTSQSTVFLKVFSLFNLPVHFESKLMNNETLYTYVHCLFITSQNTWNQGVGCRGGFAHDVIHFYCHDMMPQSQPEESPLLCI